MPSSTSERRPPTDGGDDGRAARGRFERDQPERLGARRHQARRRRRGSSSARSVVRLRRHEPHLVVDAELVDEPVPHAAQLGFAVGAARTADDHQLTVGIVERGEAAHREVDALQRLDAADEQEHAAARRDRGGARAAARSPGREHRVVDAGRRRPRCDRGRRRSSVASCARSSSVDASIRSAHATTSCSMRARCSGSSSIPASALTCASVWNVATSGRSSRVLEPVRDRARQPVVRVQDVDRWRREQQCASAASTNGSTRSTRSCFGDRLARAGVDVQHTEAGLDLHDVGLLRVLGTRVDVALDAGPGERRSERADVHVHPATVARTRLGQRRRVHAEDGDAAL